MPVKILGYVGAIFGLSAALPAIADQVACVLEVGGQSYIDGPCDFRDLSRGDGSFQINGSNGDFFAYVYVEGGGEATAHWNEIAGVTRAHTPLGRLQRDGACWVNGNTRICATRVAETDDASPYGSWDCGIMGFDLDDRTYRNSSAPAAAVATVERIAEDAFGVTLRDGYRFALFELTSDTLTWHSPASGDLFECRRE